MNPSVRPSVYYRLSTRKNKAENQNNCQRFPKQSSDISVSLWFWTQKIKDQNHQTSKTSQKWWCISRISVYESSHAHYRHSV